MSAIFFFKRRGENHNQYGLRVKIGRSEEVGFENRFFSGVRMVRLTEDMIVARTRVRLFKKHILQSAPCVMRVFSLNIKSQKVSDMNHVKKLNCWGAELSDISIIRLQFQKILHERHIG